MTASGVIDTHHVSKLRIWLWSSFTRINRSPIDMPKVNDIASVKKHRTVSLIKKHNYIYLCVIQTAYSTKVLLSYPNTLHIGAIEGFVQQVISS